MTDKPIYIANQSLPEHLEYYKEENRRLQSHISAFERECSNACGDVFTAICQRAIARMNKKLAPELGGNDAAIGEGFTFFETLSVSICHLGMDMGDINPHLPDYISDMLEDEINNLSSSDLLVIKYGDGISYDSQCGYYDFHDELLKRIKDTFYSLLEDTYNSKKVQKICT